jgi:osmotically-inducible protein OsmY
MKAKTMTQADKDLREAVERHLDFVLDVPSEKVGVTASGSVVTLSGYVETYADKLAAERAAKVVYGVRAVANDLEVKSPSEIKVRGQAQRLHLPLAWMFDHRCQSRT